VENQPNCKSSFDNVNKIVSDTNVDLLNKINDPIEKKRIKRKASDIYEKNALSSAKRKKSNVENISNCKSSFDNVDKIVCDANVDLLNKINDPIEKK
jgi:hypothetical protein